MTSTYNLRDLHAGCGPFAAHQPERFMARAQTRALIAELQCEPSITAASHELATAYLMWASPAFAARVLQARATDPAAAAVGLVPPGRVTGLLAGIDLLEPGHSIAVRVDISRVPTTRSHVCNTGVRLGRRFTTSYNMGSGVLTIQRLRVSGQAAPSTAGVERQPGWVEYDATNDLHVGYGSREAYEAAQAEALAGIGSGYEGSASDS